MSDAPKATLCHRRGLEEDASDVVGDCLQLTVQRVADLVPGDGERWDL